MQAQSSRDIDPAQNASLQEGCHPTKGATFGTPSSKSVAERFYLNGKKGRLSKQKPTKSPPKYLILFGHRVGSSSLSLLPKRGEVWGVNN